MSDRLDNRRIAAGSLAALTAVVAVVLVIRALLPVLPGWSLPALFGVVAAVLLTLGRFMAARVLVAQARVVAGWAGLIGTFALFGVGNVLGLGGGVLAIPLAILLFNVLVALWFGSSRHYAVVQWAGLVWAIVALVFGVLPLAALVLAVGGLWWTGNVRFSRGVVASTTILVPVAAGLCLHALTHRVGPFDAADVATIAGLTALALLLGSRITSQQVYAGLWPVMRTTATVVLIAQIVVAGTPAAALVLAPGAPWPGLLVGLAGLGLAVGIAVVGDHRPGFWPLVGLAALLWATIAIAVVIGPQAAALVAALGLIGLQSVVILRRGLVADGSLTRLGAVALLGAWALVGLGVDGAALVVGVFVLAALLFALGACSSRVASGAVAR